MATMLAPVDSRAVVRCDCGLVQFLPRAGMSAPCRRCHQALDGVPEPLPPLAQVPHQMRDAPGAQLPAAIRSQRLRLGLSQRQLAARLNGPRTYVSKIENGKCSPCLSSLRRVAKALDVTVGDLLSVADGEQTRQAEVRDLIKDKFVAELMPFVSQLKAMQMSSILNQVRDMSVRRRAA
jgi:transcriptional regulator with XRE-family HTH domain